MSVKKALIFLIALCAIAACVPIAYYGWSKLYYGILERTPPVIIVDRQSVKGIGLAPVTVKIRIYDRETGLDEVIIRTDQNGVRREVLRKSLQGLTEQVISYKFPGVNSKLEEGSAVLEIRAFDRSFWSNASEIRVPLQVDYRKPRVEVLTTQHNARVGGSQLVFYRAYDEALEYTGVKAGQTTFEGFPAKGLDPDFDDSSLFFSIYAIDIKNPPKTGALKIIAVDRVGNAVSVPFYNKILSRRTKSAPINLTDNFLRGRTADLFRQNSETLKKLYAERWGKAMEFSSKKGSTERLLDEFKILNSELRQYNSDQIYSLIWNKYRFEKLWDGKFLTPPGTPTVLFGTKMTYLYEGKKIGKALSQGYQIRTVPRAPVYASNSGVVVFSDNLGVYGRVVALDHGHGIVSIYGKLNSVSVREGDEVSRGEQIGVVGETGFSRYPHLYYEMRVQGIPVDPREWWDSAWVNAHIYDKIDEVKKLLGITRYIPLQ